MRFAHRGALFVFISILGAMLPALAHAKHLHETVICVDPGHPSEVADGNTVVNGTTETHCDWVVAQRLKRLLEQDGFRVVMTKKAEKQVVTNKRRAEIANRSHAALMLRLHCDAGGGAGFTVYYPDRPAHLDGTFGPAEAVCQESGRAADLIRAGLAASLLGELQDNGVAPDVKTARGRRFGGLVGSVHSRVPVVLVEMGYLDNRHDAEVLRSEAGPERIAAGLADGVRRFVGARRTP